jgi:hypothetical protein
MLRPAQRTADWCAAVEDLWGHPAAGGLFVKSQWALARASLSEFRRNVSKKIKNVWRKNIPDLDDAKGAPMGMMQLSFAAQIFV